MNLCVAEAYLYVHVLKLSCAIIIKLILCIQAILHPVQDRVLTVRENARLQGFPDYYKLCGPIKER